jgi:hypothetical protein
MALVLGRAVHQALGAADAALTVVAAGALVRISTGQRVVSDEHAAARRIAIVPRARISIVADQFFTAGASP